MKNCHAGHNIHFVILTWNSEKYVKACIDLILEFSKIDILITIADNGSTDSTRANIKKIDDCRVSLIEFNSNMGTTVSRNVALKSVNPNCEYICILDSDTVVNEDAFLTMINTLSSYRDIGLLGPTMQSSDGTAQLSGRNLPTAGIKFKKAIPIRALSDKGESEEVPETEIISSLQDVPYLLSTYWLTHYKYFVMLDYWMKRYSMRLLYIKQCGPWADFRLVVQNVGVVLTAQGN